VSRIDEFKEVTPGLQREDKSELKKKERFYETSF